MGKACTFFGHRDCPSSINPKLREVLIDLIENHTDGEKFYQYTMLEEASRKRFIYAYKENSSFSTIDFVKRAIVYFRYTPDVIQTDNGGDFTHTQKN